MFFFKLFWLSLLIYEVLSKEVSESQYYEMPKLYDLDEYSGCISHGHLYCVGTFELSPLTRPHHLYDFMENYSLDWVDKLNHTLLHRGICVSKRCPHPHSQLVSPIDSRHRNNIDDADWFEWCVDAWTRASYNMSSRLKTLSKCSRGPSSSSSLDTGSRWFLVFIALLVILAILATGLDLALPKDKRHKYGKVVECILSWSVIECWQELTADDRRSPSSIDLRVLDGLRVCCMLIVILGHVAWIGMLVTFSLDNRFSETNRRKPDFMILANSSLLIQVFFMISSFLLTHSLLNTDLSKNKAKIMLDTIVKRIVRLSPCFWFAVWFAACWWPRLGEGPLWSWMVEREASVCRRHWWTHLLYLNNLIYPDDKCLIQTWYLSADFQLYIVSAFVSIFIPVGLKTLMAAQVALGAVTIKYVFDMNLVPTFYMHRPEALRVSYYGDSTFNLIYQSPWGNLTAAIAGIMMAHMARNPPNNKWFTWWSRACPVLAIVWCGATPLLAGQPHSWSSILLAALERHFFNVIALSAILGAMTTVQSPFRSVLSWSGWRVPARLSFAVLLLHMPLITAYCGSRHTLLQMERIDIILMWWVVVTVSYVISTPVVLLLELPTIRLYRALKSS